MISEEPLPDRDPQWKVEVMKLLPEMYCSGAITGGEGCVFIYANAFLAASEELKRGATAALVREQTSRILQYVDESDRPAHDKEQFAALFARAVDDAINGRPPCVLH
jgi:hypothetical protein